MIPHDDRGALIRAVFGAFFAAVAAITMICTARADVTIVGPSGGKPGDIILLEARSDSPATYAWTVIPPQTSDGRPTMLRINDTQVIVASIPGRYHVVCAAGNAEQTTQTLWVVDISGGVPPTPPPGPGPAPPSPPDPGPVLTGIAKVAYEASRQHPEAERKMIASSYASMASKMAGVQSQYEGDEGLERLLQETTTLNQSKLDDAQETAWKRGFFTVLAGGLKAMYDEGKLDTIQQRMDTWRGITEGLSK